MTSAQDLLGEPPEQCLEIIGVHDCRRLEWTFNLFGVVPTHLLSDDNDMIEAAMFALHGFRLWAFAVTV